MIHSLNRRQSLAATSLAAIPLATPAIAQGRRQLSMVTSWPRALPVLSASADRLAERISTLTDGRISIEVAHSGEKVGPFDVFDAVANGEADLYHSAEYYFTGKHPAFAYFTSVPFGLLADELSGWLNFGGGNELWRQLSGQFGLRPLLCGNTGPQMGGWFSKPVESLADMQKLRLRIPGMGNEVWRAAGADAVNLPGSALIEALFSGQIDAVEWIGPHLDLHFGFVKLLPVYMYPGWQEPGTGIAMAMRSALWDDLTPTERVIVETSCAAETNVIRAEFRTLNAQALNIARREFGADLHPFPLDVLTSFVELAEGVLDRIAAHDALAAQVDASFRLYRQTVRRFSAISTGE